MKHSAEQTRSSLPPLPDGGWARILYWLRIAPRMPFVWFMRLYRLVVSPLYGQVCRYYPGCSKYALDAFEVKGAVRGTAMTIWRLLRCNPFSPGGIDYVSGSVLEQQSELLNKGTAAGQQRQRSRSGD